jgi:aminoglycoside 3'-phosphotransferase II
VDPRSEFSLLPPDWQSELSQARIEPVEGGLGGASLFRIASDRAPARYLKIARDGAAPVLRQEVERTAWLAHRGIRVPAILCTDDGPEHIAMLMEAVPGVAADVSTLPPLRLAEALARGLAALHALPAAECPFDESLAVRFARAAAAIAAGEVEAGAFAPRNRGIAPEALLARLIAGQQPEGVVVVHGDATLSNIIVDGVGAIGFIDCGNVGRGDRYLDLGVLAADIEDRFGREPAAHFAQAYGGEACGGQAYGGKAWDEAKARFYSDLYELF